MAVYEAPKFRRTPKDERRPIWLSKPVDYSPDAVINHAHRREPLESDKQGSQHETKPR